MSANRAYSELTELESITEIFDETKAKQYIGHVRAFIKAMRMAGAPPGSSPFFDLNEANPTEVPADILERLNYWCDQKRLSPVLRRVCHWHLKFLLLAKDDEPSPYYPVICLLRDGGDFYVHHGDICIRDTATVITSKL